MEKSFIVYKHSVTARTDSFLAPLMLDCVLLTPFISRTTLMRHVHTIMRAVLWTRMRCVALRAFLHFPSLSLKIVALTFGLNLSQVFSSAYDDIDVIWETVGTPVRCVQDVGHHPWSGACESIEPALTFVYVRTATGSGACFVLALRSSPSPSCSMSTSMSLGVFIVP